MVRFEAARSSRCVFFPVTVTCVGALGSVVALADNAPSLSGSSSAPESDSYNPNNPKGTAPPLAPGEPLQSYIRTWNEVDHFTFTLSAAQHSRRDLAIPGAVVSRIDHAAWTAGLRVTILCASSLTHKERRTGVSADGRASEPDVYPRR